MFDRDAMRAQFTEALDVFEQGLRDCADADWLAPMWPVPRTDPWIGPAPGVTPIAERTDESIQVFSAVWTVSYHCLWFLDFYTSTEGGFESPDYVRGGPEELPFPAADGAAPFPDKTFDRETLLRYLAHGRAKIDRVLASVTDEELAVRLGSWHPHGGTTLADLLRVNLAHVQEHGGQVAAFVAGRR